MWRRFVNRVAESIADRIGDTVIDRIRKKEVFLGKDELGMEVRNLMDRRFLFRNLEPSDSTGQSFMQHSTCHSADFVHPRFSQICRDIDRLPLCFHRKLWEWVYIVHRLESRNVIYKGSKGLVFGVGQESLPAYFASRGAFIVATDAPQNIGVEEGWAGSRQYSNCRDRLRHPSIIDDKVFEERVSFQFCDMREISSKLCDFDFVWSSCCLEHLGTLEAGIEFVINSVEKTLKPGGVACHTTEFNLSSNDSTVEKGGTVIYRKRDIVELIERLRLLGHSVECLSVAPDSSIVDHFVDVPPYKHNPHLRLELEGYVTTSVGITVVKGRK